MYNHNAYFSHSRTIVNRNGFDRGGFHGGGVGGREGIANSRASAGMRSGAFSGFDHGGMARSNSFRGQSSFGGFHGGGGGFHGGGGGFHGGGGGGRR